MAEEGEVHYASVVFKTKQAKPKDRTEEETVYDEVKVRNEKTEKSSDPNGRTEEETVYDEVKVRNETTEKNLDSNGNLVMIVDNVGAGLLADKETEKRSHLYQWSRCCFGTVCVILLLGIIGVCVYQNKITNLTAENKNLSKQNQELEADRKNLTEQVQNTEAKQVEFNVSRAQWSIDAYCPKENNARTCKQCEGGWLLITSSCYAVNDAQPDKRRSWEGAREDCRGKGSDLVVVGDNPEKTSVNGKIWTTSGFWIGLKAENGKWKWVDGSDLADNSWMTQEPQDGRCVILVKGEGWKSVSCDEKQQWICEKAALSV
ncbi:uncharacterized protein PAE49_004816 isoform 6-T6 [Odontesthes bonariensis]|uniref:uncharacterized protein LOC142380857 isoform X5 n=1 Tax=Odontesthes bonariensis TaxID=219752 RepID=UPI003F58F303